MESGAYFTYLRKNLCKPSFGTFYTLFNYSETFLRFYQHPDIFVFLPASSRFIWPLFFSHINRKVSLLHNAIYPVKRKIISCSFIIIISLSYNDCKAGCKNGIILSAKTPVTAACVSHCFPNWLWWEERWQKDVNFETLQTKKNQMWPKCLRGRSSQACLYFDHHKLQKV